jgi:hypothetical protein
LRQMMRVGRDLAREGKSNAAHSLTLSTKNSEASLHKETAKGV